MERDKQLILGIFLEAGLLSSSMIYAEVIKRGSEVSLVTIKRKLSELKDLGFINIQGKGRSVVYVLSTLGRLSLDVDAQKYCEIEPDKRYGQKNYNFSLFSHLAYSIFSDEEKKHLQKSTDVYHKNVTDLSPVIREKELERFVIELSWKSSRIEGNTYTLLDTERLIKEGIESKGHSKDEAKMILNHKDAFKFIRENQSSFTILNERIIDEVHKELVKELGVQRGFRSKPVGVTGSIYRPLDNVHQIKEAMESLVACVNKIEDPYTKALITLLGISYIQPFEDGNKRTARLLANGILMAHNLAPLSYRSLDEEKYREAVLVFYELNSVIAFKKIFIEQYIFAALNYAVS